MFAVATKPRYAPGEAPLFRPLRSIEVAPLDTAERREFAVALLKQDTALTGPNAAVDGTWAAQRSWGWGGGGYGCGSCYGGGGRNCVTRVSARPASGRRDSAGDDEAQIAKPKRKVARKKS